MKKANLISATIYIGAAVIISGLFLLGTLGSAYTLVDRIGGALWVFILSTIILMPIVIPFIKKKVGE
jgi:hypothetical protein